MVDKSEERTRQWGLATVAALTGLLAWLVLNSVHKHMMGGQPEGGWPASWLDSLLLMPSFVAGLAAMMVPCILQMSIVFTAVTAGVSAAGSDPSTDTRLGARVLTQTGLFILGYVAFYSIIGAGLGTLGQGLASLGSIFLLVMRLSGGLLMAALGLHLSGLLNVRIASYCRGPVGFLLGVEPKGRFGSLRAGVAFAVYCIACCGPYIFAVLAMAASSGSALLSATFLFVFSLGMAIPFVMIALSNGLAERYLQISSNHMRTVSRISGTVLIVFGVMTAIASVLQ